MASYTAAAVAAIHPTQITVPMARVEERRAQIRAARARSLEDFLTWHRLRAVLGPDARLFLVDPHAVARALLDEGVEHCYVTVELDLSHMRLESFWIAMERQGWAQPYDERGQRRSFSAIPDDFRQLQDDPYRSLACWLQEARAFDSAATRSELLWANFLRSRIPRAMMRRDPAELRRLALEHAASPEARPLPGWRG